MLFIFLTVDHVFLSYDNGFGNRASPMIFKKIGIALSCVVANVMTSVIIISLIYVSEIAATKGSFALYVIILYVGFPMTIISNLTTGPMLDRVAPYEKKAIILGINAAIFDNWSYIPHCVWIDRRQKRKLVFYVDLLLH